MGLLFSTRRALVGSGGIAWLLNDEFIDTRAAGAVNGTPATPGPGTRAAVDDNSKLTMGGGVANYATGGVGAGNPGLWWDVQARAAGRVLVASVTPSGVVNAHAGIGWDANQGGAITDSLNFAAGGALQFVANGAAAYTVGAFTATAYRVALVHRGTGMYAFIKGGAFTTWTLLTISAAGNAAAYPGIGALGATSVFTADFARIPPALWNPPLLAYDTFTRANGALGTSETTGPEAQVVTARTWASIGGDLQIVGNAVQGVAAQSNLVANPGFEAGGTGGDFNGGAEIDDGISDTFISWDTSSINDGAGNKAEATATVHAGAVAVKLQRTTSSSSIYQSVVTTPGRLYQYKFWTRGDGAQPGVYRLQDVTNGTDIVALTDGTVAAVYVSISRIVAAPTGCVSARVRFYAPNVAGVGYFDDASLLPVHAHYVDIGVADAQLVYNITTPAAGTTPFGCILRRSGATQWLAKVTPGTAGTDFELIELSNGVPTARATADVDWAAATGYSIQVSCSGQSINVYAAGTLYLTYASAAVGVSNTHFGWFDAAEANASLLDVQMMNKSGAYSTLDLYSS